MLTHNLGPITFGNFHLTFEGSALEASRILCDVSMLESTA